VDNIWGLLARGQKARATGVMSYSFFDWAYAEHFYHLSRAAKETGRICRAQVDLEFARRIFGRSWREGTTALRLLNDYGLLVGGICGAEGYQPDKGTLGKCVVQNRQRLHMMERMLAWADQAHSLLRPLAQGPATGLAGRVRRSLWAEAVRTRNLLEEFVILARAYPKRPSRPELQHCLRLHREIAEAIEQNKPHYVIPMDMVYLTPMQEYLEDACSV
jgi:hypothetical protein